MNKLKQILVTEKLASLNELRLTPEQAFQVFGLEVRPEFQDLRLKINTESLRGGNSCALSLLGSRPETLEEEVNRELKKFKTIKLQHAFKQKSKKSIPPSWIVRNNYKYQSWCSISVCPDCGLVGKYEDLHVSDPCPSCGVKVKKCTGRWINSGSWWKFWAQEGYWEALTK